MSHLSRLLRAGALALLLPTGFVAVALAHAEFASSIPAPNSTVTSVPSTVKVVFTEGVNPQGSSLTVLGPSGVADRGDGHVDQSDPDRKTMLVSLKSGLGPGKYTVNWKTVSADDGDTATGSFVFTVAAATTAGQATPAALPRTGGVPPGLLVAAAATLVGGGLIVRRRAS